MATIALFAVVGPLLGYAVFLAIVALGMSKVPPPPPGVPPAPYAGLWYGLHPLLLAIVYIVAGVPALVTGLGTVIIDRWMRTPELRYVAAAICGAASAPWFMFLNAQRNPSAVDQAAGITAVAILGAVAAVACAFLTRRWRYRAV